MQDLRQAKEYLKFMAAIGWQIEKGLVIKKLPLIPFRVAKYQRPEQIDWKKLKTTVRQKKVNYLIIEPGRNQKTKKIIKELRKRNFKKTKWPMLPTKTVWLDLSKTEEQLLKEMRPKTRYNIKKCSQIKVKQIRGDKLDIKILKSFYEIYKKNSQRQKFWGMRFEHIKKLMEVFGKNGYLLWVENLGGLIILKHKETTYYTHNGVTLEGKKKLVPTKLTWEAIRLAKKLRCKRFDFEGIADQRFKQTKSWMGFSKFKMGFGGEVIEYEGSFYKFYSF